MSVHSPEQLIDMAQHTGENVQPEESALSLTQILVRMLHLHCRSATCTAEPVLQNTIQQKLNKSLKI